MANNYLQFSIELPLGEHFEKALEDLRTLALYEDCDQDTDNAPDWVKEVTNDDWYLDCRLEPDAATKSFWIFAEESGDVERLANLLFRWVDTFGLDPVYITWAETCSKMRIDQFGGGAVVISKKKGIEWMSTYQWVSEKLEELKS